MQSYGLDQTSNVEGLFVGQVDVLSGLSVNQLNLYRRNASRQSLGCTCASAGSSFGIGFCVGLSIGFSIGFCVGLSVSFCIGIGVGLSIRLSVCFRARYSCYSSLRVGICVRASCSCYSGLCSISCFRSGSCGFLILQNNNNVTLNIERCSASSCALNGNSLGGLYAFNFLVCQLVALCNFSLYICNNCIVFSISNFESSGVSAGSCANSYIGRAVQQSSNIAGLYSDLNIYAGILQAAVYRRNSLVELCAVLANQTINGCRQVCCGLDALLYSIVNTSCDCLVSSAVCLSCSRQVLCSVILLLHGVDLAAQLVGLSLQSCQVASDVEVSVCTNFIFCHAVLLCQILDLLVNSSLNLGFQAVIYSVHVICSSIYSVGLAAGCEAQVSLYFLAVCQISGDGCGVGNALQDGSIQSYVLIAAHASQLVLQLRSQIAFQISSAGDRYNAVFYRSGRIFRSVYDVLQQSSVVVVGVETSNQILSIQGDGLAVCSRLYLLTQYSVPVGLYCVFNGIALSVSRETSLRVYLQQLICGDLHCCRSFRSVCRNCKNLTQCNRNCDSCSKKSVECLLHFSLPLF